MNFNTPILFIIFNRPDTTLRVFSEIKKIKPAKLYVVADGSRNESELKKCTSTRAILDSIDWPCEVFKNYSEINLGCKERVSSGIDWFFEHEDYGIILEDDCLPEQTFFRFCEEMLTKYKDDERIGMVSGNNFQFGKIKNEYSYYFSTYSHIWGWATWKRAWKKYDVEISSWPTFKREKKLEQLFSRKSDVFYWQSIFDDVHKNKIDTWDYQWTYTCFFQNYLSIMPSVNLISNIGFGESDSTHTKKISKFSNIDTQSLEFPLKHPFHIVKDIESDTIVQKNNYPFLRHFLSKILRKIKLL